MTPLDPRILGEVRDLVTDDPIAGATVAYSGGVMSTDSLGRYTFTNVVPGTYPVTVSASGYADFVQQAVVNVRTWTSLDFHLAPSGNAPRSFPAVADALVKTSSPAKNQGSLDYLQVRAPDPEYRSFVKFDVSGVSGAVESAKVWLYVTDPSPDGGALYYVGNTWTETSLTWNNAPALTGAPLGQAGSVQAGNWVSFDVSSVVSGNGSYAFALAGTSTNSAMYSSREGANPPVLVVETGGQPVLPNVSAFSPPSGPAGTEVTITGANFTGTTEVAFYTAHTMAFTVDSDTQIRAVVPVGATTGPISVKNGAGTAVSALDFTVATGAPVESHFAPLDDAHVQSGSPTRNYGGDPGLRAKTEATSYKFFLKFAVSGLGGAVQSAKLRLFVTDASKSGGSLFGVSNNLLGTSTSWGEYSLNWNNAPALPGTATSSVGAAPIGTWVEFDVTPLVTGNGTYSFGVSSAITDSVIYSSKEGPNPPDLVVQTAP
jgi:Carboxypeptidase regulatory-like domain/IPT/TIG domain